MVGPAVVSINDTRGNCSNSLGKTAIATKSVPPRLTVAIKNSTLSGSDLDIGSANLDERIVGISVLPEGLAFERDLGSFLQLRQVDGRVTRNGDTVEGNSGAGCCSSWDS